MPVRDSLGILRTKTLMTAPTFPTMDSRGTQVVDLPCSDQGARECESVDKGAEADQELNENWTMTGAGVGAGTQEEKFWKDFEEEIR